MKWSKRTTAETAIAYRDTFTKDIVGRYTDASEQEPVLKMMELKENAFILDAGCGTGRYLANICRTNQFLAVDVSLEMIKVARNQVKKGFYVVGDIEHLPLKECIFDEVICVRVLQHIKNQMEAIKELSRVCRVGGNVILLSLNSWTLHCLYKNMRMTRLIKIINHPFKYLLGKKVASKLPFGEWAFDYDNYCSSPELCRMFKSAGLNVLEERGGTIGSPWLFNYSYLGKVLEKLTPNILRYYFKKCRVLEDMLSCIFPFKYLLDKVIIKGIKEGRK